MRGEAATLPFFSKGQFVNPMVLRIPGLAYQKGFGGHFHNENSITIFRDVPGLIVASPSNGADAVMIGTPLAQSTEAPGKGVNWGMASPHPALPRGTRVDVGTKGSLEQLFYGPSSVSDGTQNLIGALKACMGMVGALNIQEMHEAEVIVAPSIKTEGKHYQLN